MTNHHEKDSASPHPAQPSEDAREGTFTVEVWRNRVFGRHRLLYRVLDALSRVLGPTCYHLMVLVRYPNDEVGSGDCGRYEIFEPFHYAPREGNPQMPVSIGGFLQRRYVTSRLRERSQDEDSIWDLHLVWSREYPASHPALGYLTEEAVARYRWRDHYPHWWHNVLGRSINSNTFVEKLLATAGVSNPDGSAVDLTSGGRYHQPGIGRSEGWDYAYDGDTELLHEEWERLHGRTGGRWWRLWASFRGGASVRFVRAEPPYEPINSSTRIRDISHG